MESNKENWNYYSDEPPVKTNRYVKTILKIAAPLIGAFCFYFLYSGRFDYFFFDMELIIVPAIIVLIIIPVMLVQTSKVWIQNENVKAAGMFLGIISILINGPFLGYWTGVVEERAYAAYGVKTKGIVTQAWESKGRRMYYEFEVNRKMYTSFNVSNDKGYKEGDSVLIIYNKHNPEMNQPL